MADGNQQLNVLPDDITVSLILKLYKETITSCVIIMISYGTN